MVDLKRWRELSKQATTYGRPLSGTAYDLLGEDRVLAIREIVKDLPELLDLLEEARDIIDELIDGCECECTNDRCGRNWICPPCNRVGKWLKQLGG